MCVAALAGERLISIHNGTTSDSPKLFESTEFMEGFEKKVNFTSTSGFYIRFIGNITKYHGIRLIYTVYDDRPLTHSASGKYPLCIQYNNHFMSDQA